MPRDPECEVHHYLMGDGRCTCTVSHEPIPDEAWREFMEWLERAPKAQIAGISIKITFIDGNTVERGYNHTEMTAKITRPLG